MFCHNCGSTLEDGVKFCPNCGAPIVEPEIVEAPVIERSAEPVSDNGFSKSLTAMIFSIIGAIFSTNPYTSLFGIIFSAIAKGILNKFVNAGYQIGPAGLAKKAKASGIFAKVAKIVSTVGLILSIVMFVILIIFIVLFIFAGIANAKH